MEKIRVVLIDDNEGLVGMINEYFSSNRAGIEVVYTAENGKKGLDIIRNKQEDYDLIVLDLVMPELDGVTVLEKKIMNKMKKDILSKTG